MLLTSFTLVLWKTHRFIRQTGAAGLFVMLQWAGFLLVAAARACSSWALLSPGLQKKCFSVFKGFFSQGFPPAYAWWHLLHHLWLRRHCICVHSPARGPTGTEIPSSMQLNFHPPEEWPSAICPVGRAQWHSLSPRLGLGTSWEDMNWLGEKLG